MRVAVTLGLTGRYAMQSAQALAGLELWAEDDDVDLHVGDDAGVSEVALNAYEDFLGGDYDVLLAPYSSGLVRRVAPTVCGAGRLLWNHGGSADDVARPGLVSVLAPASSYLRPLVQLAHGRGVGSVLLLQGTGRFAQQVIAGAVHEAGAVGLPVRVADVRSWGVPASLTGQAVFLAGTFDEDVEAIRRLRMSGVAADMVGCVAAGIREFAARLGPLADGALAPTQWLGRDRPVEIGPTAPDFARRFKARSERLPDYPAAQAAATGWLAAEATRRGWSAHEVQRWRTTTLLGGFALDASWRQVGHTPAVVQWRGNRLEPL